MSKQQMAVEQRRGVEMTERVKKIHYWLTCFPGLGRWNEPKERR